MKIAFILLCHKNPKQINSLISKLLLIDSEIFIHFDKKSYALSSEIIENERVHILSFEESFSINWGGMGMIYATLQLMNKVLSAKENFEYIWLLSGQDYMITSPQKIYNFLKLNDKFNYIDIIEKNDDKYNRYKKLYELWYPTWINKNNFFVKIIKRLYMIITGGYYRTFNIFVRKRNFNQDFYFGSQWWTLTTNCCEYIVKYCKDNPEYIKYFKNTIIPDECFFQTIFMNSEFKNYRKENLTFVNWKENSRSPSILKESDFELIERKSENFCFARKFDQDVDNRIFNKINDILLNSDELGDYYE